jgi:hypothetical protein
MTTKNAGEYRNDPPGLALVRNDQPKAVRHLEARRRIERRAHDLVLMTTSGGVPAFHADWHYDLRRGRLRIFGGLLRFIDVSVARGVPRAFIDMIPDVLRAYIQDQFDAAEAAMAKPTHKAA